MTNPSIRYYLPFLLPIFVSIFLIWWAVDQESRIQGSVILPAGFAFKAYVPGRYAIYLDMDVYPENNAKHLANMRAIPQVICEVRGAGHLNRLTANVWQCGGLSRYTRAPDGSKRILVPFAEFDILWPGNYEVRAAFTKGGTKDFLISIGQTSLMVPSLIIIIITLIMTFIVFLWRAKKKRPHLLKSESTKRPASEEDL
jgi:hypothetical protein